MTPPVTLDYLGHCAFLWSTAHGVRALIDPYGNSAERHWFLRPFPELEVDVVMSTHRHFDHDATGSVPGRPTVLRGAGKFTLADLSVEGVAELHARREGREPLANTIFVVEAGGVRFCHMGDNRAGICGEARRAIGHIDVFMVNVDDSSHLLTFDEVGKVIEAIGPKVVIPMHYSIPRLTSEGSTLGPIDCWLESRSRIRRMEDGPFKIGYDSIPREQETWVMTASLG